MSYRAAHLSGRKFSSAISLQIVELKSAVYHDRSTNSAWGNKTGNIPVTYSDVLSCQPLLPCKSNKYYIFWVCVCSLRYQACNAHAPYCHLWPARLYNIVPHYLINGAIFGRKLSNTKKRVLIFSTACLQQSPLREEFGETYDPKCTQDGMWSNHYSYHILTKRWIL